VRTRKSVFLANGRYCYNPTRSPFHRKKTDFRTFWFSGFLRLTLVNQKVGTIFQQPNWPDSFVPEKKVWWLVQSWSNKDILESEFDELPLFDTEETVLDSECGCRKLKNLTIHPTSTCGLLSTVQGTEQNLLSYSFYLGNKQENNLTALCELTR
jgi:hypothetical protein